MKKLVTLVLMLALLSALLVSCSGGATPVAAEDIPGLLARIDEAAVTDTQLDVRLTISSVVNENGAQTKQNMELRIKTLGDGHYCFSGLGVEAVYAGDTLYLKTDTMKVKATCTSKQAAQFMENELLAVGIIEGSITELCSMGNTSATSSSGGYTVTVELSQQALENLFGAMPDAEVSGTVKIRVNSEYCVLSESITVLMTAEGVDSTVKSETKVMARGDSVKVEAPSDAADYVTVSIRDLV